MDGFSTLTQKGQVAIPKAIRDYLHLKPFDKVRFTTQDGKIIGEPVLGIEDMFGSVPVKKTLAKKDAKEMIKNQVLKKYENRP